MSYLAYHFTVNPPQPGSEILMAMISDYDFDSFDYTETGFTAYIKEEAAGDIQFDDLQFDDFTYAYRVETIALTNWNEDWEKNFDPVYVDRLLEIRAPFHKRTEGIQHEIVIMPKMSFGTGHHQTTRLMCRQMFETVFADKVVLDMGCGTGILAILAKQRGAAEVLGIDIDEWSVENSIENCLVNQFPTIQIKKGDAALLETKGNFDMILANINKNILKADVPVYSKHLNDQGQLFLSGFFTTDGDELKALCGEHNLRFKTMKNENEWAMMVFEKIGDA